VRQQAQAAGADGQWAQTGCGRGQQRASQNRDVMPGAVAYGVGRTCGQVKPSRRRAA